MWGANIGAAAVYFLGLFPEARIVCFEPSPTNLEFLRRNTAFTNQIEVHPIGLSDFTGNVPLYIGKSQLMQNSIYPNEGVRCAHESAEIRDAGAEFDRLGFKDVSILKLDTEGCELPILRALGNRRNAIEIIYLEYHSESDRLVIDALLAERFVLAQANVTAPHRGS